MSDWLSDVIGNDLIAVFDVLYFTEDALLWLREKPRTFGELRAKEIDWLRWMAANVQNKDLKVTPTGQSRVETLFTGKSEN